MPRVSHRMQAGIYWPPSPAPFQNPSNPFSPHDQSTTRSIPGTPGTPYLTSILNLRTDDFTGESPAPFPSTPVPSAEQSFDASASNIDASIGFMDRGLDDTIMEQYPFDFPELFSYDTNTDFLSMEMCPDLIAEALDDHQNLRSEMAPPRRRRYKEEQEKDYTQRLHELESLHGPEHPATIDIHLRLARVFRDQGRYRAAEPLNRQAASTSQRFLGNDHETTFMAVQDLIFIFFCQGRQLIAETHYRSLRRRALTVFGRKHDVTLLISFNMATVLANNGKLNESVILEREALEILEKAWPGGSGAICSIGNLAVSLLSLNQLEEAERLLQDAVRLQEKLPLDEVAILDYKLQLARVWKRQDRYEESEKMHREVLRLLRSLLGPEHPYTLIAMECLTEVLDIQERHEESKKMKLEVLAGRTKVLGPNHPDTKVAQRALVSVLSL
jgi:tetratricopeptide (TPR) repeat protein